MLSRSLAAGAAALLAACGLSACSSSTDTGAAASSAPPASAATCPVTIADAWVKAADSGMTAAFGTLSNPSSEAVTITAASSPATSMMELHEVVEADGQMVMQPKEGGFPVPAGGSLTLEPGGYHLMLMDVTDPIETGEDVAFTLTCSTGATMTFTAQAKTFEGGDETYVGDGMDGMDGMDMSSSPSPASS
jgi:periplasmic copper chaperone A